MPQNYRFITERREPSAAGADLGGRENFIAVPGQIIFSPFPVSVNGGNYFIFARSENNCCALFSLKAVIYACCICLMLYYSAPKRLAILGIDIGHSPQQYYFPLAELFFGNKGIIRSQAAFYAAYAFSLNRLKNAAVQNQGSGHLFKAAHCAGIAHGIEIFYPYPCKLLKRGKAAVRMNCMLFSAVACHWTDNPNASVLHKFACFADIFV